MNTKGVINVTSVGVLIAVLTFIFIFVPDVHDFTISVDPTQIDIEQGGIVSTAVEVDSGLLYYEVVSLRAESVPSLIRVDFEPRTLKHGSRSVSTLTIVAENETPTGEYLISIVGSGADKEHGCKLTLKVHNRGWSPLAVTPTETQTEINITYPLDGASVGITESVKGTQKNIPAGDEIWIFVHPHTENKYYPQRSSAAIQNGEWSLSVCIGSESDAGKKFDIIAVLADTKAQEEINAYFETCEKTGEWPGMDNIPNSAKEYDNITVTRNSTDPEIQITYPSDGAEVGITESVKGTQKNIPDDKALWIVVFPYISNNYHPAREVHVHGGVSDFAVPVIIGTDENSGEKFDIIAVLADKEAQEVFVNYLETAAEQQNWPGISNLSEGAEEMYRVTVTRK